MFDFSNYSAKSKYYDDSRKLVVGKMKHDTGAVAIKELAGLKPKMYSFLVDDCSKHKNKIKMLLQEWVIVNTKMSYWIIIIVWSIQWIESKVKLKK